MEDALSLASLDSAAKKIRYITASLIRYAPQVTTYMKKLVDKGMMLSAIIEAD